MSESRRLASLACALLFATLLAGCNGADDPTSVIDDIRQAARDSSFLQLEQSVAVDDLLPDITERAVGHMTESWSSTRAEQVELDRWIDYSRQALQACVRREVRDDEARRCQSVDQLLTFTGIRLSEFTGADVVDRTDSVASLRLRFENARLDTTVALGVRAERQGESWNIVDTENLSTVASRVQRRQDSILQAINDSLREVIRGKVPTRSRVYRWRDDASSSIYQVRLSVVVKNETDRPIDRIFLEVGDGITNGAFPESTADPDTMPPLAPGDSVDLHDTNEVVWSLPCTDLAVEADLCRLENGDRPEVEVSTVRFEDGSWLGLHDDWYSYIYRTGAAERRRD